jgi:hypothetical protein
MESHIQILPWTEGIEYSTVGCPTRQLYGQLPNKVVLWVAPLKVLTYYRPFHRKVKLVAK